MTPTSQRGNSYLQRWASIGTCPGQASSAWLCQASDRIGLGPAGLASPSHPACMVCLPRWRLKHHKRCIRSLSDLADPVWQVGVSYFTHSWAGPTNGSGWATSGFLSVPDAIFLFLFSFLVFFCRFSLVSSVFRFMILFSLFSLVSSFVYFYVFFIFLKFMNIFLKLPINVSILLKFSNKFWNTWIFSIYPNIFSSIFF